MPKRKRSAQSGLLATLEKHQDEIFRALKSAKGFERQRQSKRLHQDGVQADKRQRMELEIAVLKVSYGAARTTVPRGSQAYTLFSLSTFTTLLVRI